MSIPVVKEDSYVAKCAISLIAAKENRSLYEVRQSIKVAALLGMLNEDPDVKKKWQSVPCEKEYPEPEEIINWLSSLVLERLKTDK